MENIGIFSLYKQFNILECFLEKDDIFLFHSFNTKVSEIKLNQLKRLKNKTFSEFCEGLLYFEPNNEEILKSNLISVFKRCKDKYDRVETVEELFSKLLIQDEVILNWEEIDEIKLLIFKAFHFDNDNIDDKKWINERSVFENKFYLDEQGLRRGSTSSIWFYPKNRDEILKAMSLEINYSCVVLKKEAKFTRFSYILYYAETAADYDLLIFDYNGCFCENVIPRLQKHNLFTKIIEVSAN